VANYGTKLYGSGEYGDAAADVPFLFENQPIGEDGQLSFLFWNKTEATSDLVFGEVDGKARLVEIAVAGTFPALVGAPSVQVDVEATLPGLTAAAYVIPDVQVAALVELPALTLAASKRPSVPLSATATMPMLTMVAEALYETNTQRPTVGKTDAPHQVATKFQEGTGQPQQDASNAQVGWEAFFQKVTGGHQPIVHKLPDVLKKTTVQNAGVFQDASSLHNATGYRHQDGTPTDQVRKGVFQDGTKTHDSTFYRHQDGTKTHSLRGTQFQDATPVFKVNGTSFQKASSLRKYWDSLFQDGVPPPAGLSIYLPPQPPVREPCYTPSGELVYAYRWWNNDTNLLFVCDNFEPPEPPPGPVIVPVQRVYIVINNVNLRRVSDNAVVPTLSMSLSLDVSSWTWGFDATLPMQAQALVEPTTGPVELQASINGTNFRVMVENISRERSFGQASLRVSGRGRNAVLDSPYAQVLSFTNSIERTANQLAEDALMYNGVPIGWAVEWGLTDWLVPAGVFTHQGTHISALNAIAQAAGGYLQPHKTAQTLRILPKYPVAPWAWDTVTPDFVLPADVTTRESIQWVDKPQYNRVFVSGQQAGVLGQVTRQGTAGDVLAQMVTDPLITHADAARQRGIAILGDTGRIATVGLSLPVLAETGIIEPGKFVSYVDGATTRLGLVRSTQVSVGASAVETRQQITLETHDEPV
jgi:hypothetical protein